MPVTYTNFDAAGAKKDAYLNQATKGFANVSTLLGKADSALIKAAPAAPDKTESARFTTWFGPYTAPNIAIAKGIIHTMVTQLQASGTVTVRYDPASHDFAYVLLPAGWVAGAAPAKVAALTINLGSNFFTAPLLGKDSQNGTMIHELSHLVGHTDDQPNAAGGGTCYGEANCKALAKANPAHALLNADNYLFYCCSFGLV